jgi:hypothetical protein
MCAAMGASSSCLANLLLMQMDMQQQLLGTAQQPAATASVCMIGLPWWSLLIDRSNSSSSSSSSSRVSSHRSFVKLISTTQQ